MTDVHGITVFGGTFPAEIWNKVYTGGEVPCEEFSEPSQQVSWAPYYGEFTSGGPNDPARESNRKPKKPKKRAKHRRGRPRSAATTRAPTRPAPGRNRRRCRRRYPNRRRPRPGSAAASPPAAGSPRLPSGLAYALIWAGFLGYLAVLVAAPRLGSRVVWGLIAPPRHRRGGGAGAALARRLQLRRLRQARGEARARPLPRPVPTRWRATPPSPASLGPKRPSAYGPLFTLATYPLAWLGVGTAVAILKAVAALSVLGLAAIVARLAAPRGLDPARAAAFVALNPLVLVHVVGGAHNDGLMMLLAMLAVAALLAGREAAAGASLVAAVAIKSAAAFLAPFALAESTAPGRSATKLVAGALSPGPPWCSGSPPTSGSAGTGCTPSASPAKTRAAPAI